MNQPNASTNPVRQGLSAAMMSLALVALLLLTSGSAYLVVQRLSDLNDGPTDTPGNGEVLAFNSSLGRVEYVSASAGSEPTFNTTQFSSDGAVTNIANGVLVTNPVVYAAMTNEFLTANQYMATDANKGVISINPTNVYSVAVTNQSDDLAVGRWVYFPAPFAMTVVAVKAFAATAPTGSGIAVDINEAGTSILSTKLTIDATETDSSTAATNAVISDAAIADRAAMSIDIDVIGSSTAGKGVVVDIYYTR